MKNNVFGYTEIRILQNILDINKYNLTMKLYENYIYFDKYVKLLLGHTDYTKKTIAIISPKSTIENKIILFEIPEHHIRGYEDIKFEVEVIGRIFDSYKKMVKEGISWK